MKRLFAALKIDPDITFLDSFQKMRGSLFHEPIRWSEQKNFHVTLKFFGETATHEISRIEQIVNNIAENSLSFDIFLMGLGIFGSTYSPKVIWARVEPYAKISALMESIQRDLNSTGLSSDNQNIVPHLTLGRIKVLKDKVLFKRVIEQFNNIRSTSETVTEIILYNSILTGAGPEYQIIERYALKKTPPES